VSDLTRDEMVSEFKEHTTRDYSEIRSEIAHKEAAERGCIVVVPGVRELFIDIDNDAQHETFNKNIEIVKRIESGAQVRRARSPSGEQGHWHIVVTLKRDLKDEAERIMLQSILGSDPMREALSWQRLQAGDKQPTLFFEKP
jgi:hypothetical protein